MGKGVAESPIRPAVPADIPDVAALWCEAFPGERTVAERSRLLETGGPYGGLEAVLVSRNTAGELVAACSVYRLTQYLAGAPLPMMGLAGVAVGTPFRRQGLGARLCEHALRVARERGDVVSALYPFRPAYYERLGWGLVGELHDHHFRTAALPRYEESRFARVADRPGDAAAIAACYDRVAERSNGPIARSGRVWAHRTRGAVVYDRDVVSGYAVLRPGTNGGEAREAVRIRELVAETDEAYRGLLGYLARRAGRWPVARHTARVDERFGDHLAEPRPPGARRARSLYFPTARVIRGPMLRILDLPRALELRQYGPGAAARLREATLEIAVEDKQIPENRGPWLVRIEGGSVEVAPGTSPSADASIHTDAPTLARVLAGDLAPSSAPRTGRARIHGDGAVLDAAFATHEGFWLLDEF